MSDRDLPTLRFSSAELKQRLLGPMERVLRVACADLGVLPAVGLTRHEPIERAGEREHESMRSRARGSVVPSAGPPAPGPAAPRSVADASELLDVASERHDTPRFEPTASRPLDASEERPAPDPFVAAPEPAVGAPASLTASRPRAAASRLASVAPRPPVAAGSLEPAEPRRPSAIASSATESRIRLRPRHPGGTSERPPHVGVGTSPMASSLERDLAVPKLGIRALPVREHVASVTHTSPGTTTPVIDRAVPLRTSSAARANPEPLALATASAAARVLVPVIEALPEPTPQQGTTRLDASSSQHARSSDMSWAPAPSSPRPTLTTHEPVAFGAPSAPYSFVSAPEHPLAASSREPTPRLVSLDAPASLLPVSSGPSHTISEHALASVIAAAARRHGIDT